MVSGSNSFSLFRQIAGFGLAGIIGFFIEYSIISVAVMNGYGAVVPRVFSQPLAILVTFFINRYISFDNRSTIALKEIGAYYLGMWTGATASFLFYTLMVFYELSHTKSLIMATLVGAILNFLFSRSLFMKRS